MQKREVANTGTLANKHRKTTIYELANKATGAISKNGSTEAVAVAVRVGVGVAVAMGGVGEGVAVGVGRG